MTTIPNSMLKNWAFSRKKGLRLIALHKSGLANNFEPFKHMLFGRTGVRMKVWDGTSWQRPAWWNDTVATKSGSYTLTQDDRVVVFTATATATLPPATGSGQTYRIICRSGAVTIDANASETIKGELTQILYTSEDLIITDTATGVWE